MDRLEVNFLFIYLRNELLVARTRNEGVEYFIWVIDLKLLRLSISGNDSLILRLAIILCSVVIIFPEEETQEEKIVRMLGSLEAQVAEYEAIVQSYRAELIASKDEPLSHVSSSNLYGNDSKKSHGGLIASSRLKTINIYHALPNLMETDDALVPALVIGKDRIGGQHSNKLSN